MIEVVRVDYVGNKPIVHLFSDSEDDILPTDKIGILEINHGATCILKIDGFTPKKRIFCGSTREWILYN